MFDVDAGDARRSWSSPHVIDLRRTCSVFVRAPGDPTAAWASDGALWRAVGTPGGSGTIRLHVTPGSGGSTVHAQAWGPGADWLVERSPEWLGETDDASSFVPVHPLIGELTRRFRGWRVPASRCVLDELVPAVLEQKVTGGEARTSWRQLVRAFGDVAPGPWEVAPSAARPQPLRLVPDARRWALIPSWEWHRAGVGPQRSAAIVGVATLGQRHLHQWADLDGVELERRLRTVRGIGVWTAAEVRARALGDADAISVGDLHIPRLVIHSLTGRVSDDDAEMLALLEPYRGHRYRVQRLLEMSGHKAPRFGPRYAPQDMRRI